MTSLLRVALAIAVLSIPVTGSAATFRVSSPDDSGPDTLRWAIVAANREPGSTIQFDLPIEDVVTVKSALPTIRARGTRIEGEGATIREGEGCERPGGKKGCDALVVSGPDIVVRNLRIAGFLFDAVSVRGAAATGVRVEGIHAINNGDDGVGVSYNARSVVVSDCVLMGNGFRTKGKGLLVFSEAQATLRNSVVVGNRDGVTVTRGSRAFLEDVLVVGNYDKGLGVSAGEVVASKVLVVGNGNGSPSTGPAPNGDGLRVGLGGKARMSHCLIAGNGDVGVVVLDQSLVTLDHCRVEANRRKDTDATSTGVLEFR